ncbi:MAG TPA: S8 family serine peptidase [Gaiellaceae bacterium]|nr:S8 family serine peptidase [Gaiellaceae bacterium]
MACFSRLRYPFASAALVLAAVAVPAASADGWKHGHRGKHRHIAVAVHVQPAPPVQRSSTTPAYVPNVLLVRFRSGVSSARQAVLLQGLGLRTKEEIGALRVRAVYIDPAHRADIVAALSRSSLVAGIDRDEVFHAMGTPPVSTTIFSQQWGLQVADFITAFQRTHGSSSIIVAVIDTGVDASQPALAGALLPGLNLVTGGTNVADDNGHGTAVAGVIAARAVNGAVGVCSACTILPIKALDAKGSGDLASVAVGITKAADLGARVINLSLGGPLGLDVLQQAVDYAESKGAVVVAASGNSGTSSPFYPAGYPTVLSVAGTDQTDHLYPWSDYGTWVRVAAPGCNVAPLVAGGYGEFCGTSSATPLVAGLAALALSATPTGTMTQVVNAIQSTAQHIAATVQFGRIDASAALSALGVPAAQATLLNVVLRGTLTPTLRTRSYVRAVSTGAVTAVLRFPTRRVRLTLTIRTSAGDRVATVSGVSPLRLRRSVAGDMLRFVVSNRAKTKVAYTLTLSYLRSGP